MSTTDFHPAGKADFVFKELPAWESGQNASRPLSLAVGAGQIMRVGRFEDLRDLIGPDTELYQERGLLMPAFCDAHLHPFMGGQALLECDLSEASGPEDCRRTIAAYLQSHPEGQIITGGGWHDGDFEAPGPRRADLDHLEKERPVLLYSIDRHSLWVNSKALALAGITTLTPDPPGGVIERDQSGEPSGTLREWSAMALAEKIIPPPAQKDLRAYAEACFKLCFNNGITSLHDAMAEEESLQAYCALLDQDPKRPYVSVSILCQPDDGPQILEKAAYLRSTYQRAGLGVASLKFFMDGVAEGHTAWLQTPYADKADYCGDPIWEYRPFLEMLRRANKLGFQIHVHTIGDAAIEQALKAMETVSNEDGRMVRPQLAHIDLATPDQLRRIKKLGVTANLQPAWFYQDSVFDKVLLPALGPERADRLYPLRDIMRAGISIACSSDWPASGDFLSLSPLDGIQIGATRKPLGQPAAQSWQPEQTVPASYLMNGYTSGGAWSMFREEQTGRLRPGMQADLIVLDRDITAMDETDIAKAQITLTMRQGHIVQRTN